MPGSISNRKDFEHMVTGYDAAIAYVDHHLGIVLDELAKQGVLDDTAIIITSDHGDAFGEHGIYSDHVCADECIHHIPLIVNWPGVTKPGTNVRLDALQRRPAADPVRPLWARDTRRTGTASRSRRS